MTKEKKTTTRNATFTLVCIALFTALIAVGAFIKVPIPVIPFTLQTFFVTLAGMLLGKKGGAISAALYMVLGLIGLPIFTGGGGIGYIFKPSFGFTIGFIFGAFITGLIVEKLNKITYLKLVGASLAGFAAVYVIGLIYMYIILNFYMGNATGVWDVLWSGCIIFIPTDLLKTLLASFIALRLIPVVNKYNALI